MRGRLKNFIGSLCIVLGGLYSVSASAALTIYPNATFPQDYYLNAGQTYTKGDASLTYKMMNVPGQVGLFDSYEQSILYIEIIGVSGLPTGMAFDQALNIHDPLSNTLFLYGSIPAAFPAGVYPVTITGRDGAMPANTASEVIYLHISTSVVAPPTPVSQSPQINGNKGDAVPTNLPPLNTPLLKYFVSTAPIDSFKVSGGDDPSSFGLSFDTTSGNFSGTYAQAGTYVVQVEAHNSGGWSNALPVNFNIHQPPVPITQAATVAGNIGDSVPTNLPPLNKPMSAYFTSATPVDSYQLSGGDNPATFGLTFDTTTGNFSGGYTVAGSYIVKVEAHNSAGWSTAQLVSFEISQPPVPNAQQPQVTGNIGDSVPTQLPPLNLPLSGYFDSALSVDSYKITGGNPSALGLTFDTTTGAFSGNYSTAGTFAILVEAHNSAGWSTDQTVNFVISQPQQPPAPNAQQPQITGNVGDTAPTSLPPLNLPLSGYFTSALTVDAYKIVGTVDPSSFGLTLDTSAGQFNGTYTAKGTYAVQVAAHNSAGWSTPQTVNFAIAQPPTSATLTCPTVQQLGGGFSPLTFPVHDSANNTYTLALTSSVGLINTFFGATITNNGSNVTLMCGYVSNSGGGPTIIYDTVLPLNSSITGGNSCLNKAGPSACVVNIPL